MQNNFDKSNAAEKKQRDSAITKFHIPYLRNGKENCAKAEGFGGVWAL